MKALHRPDEGDGEDEGAEIAALRHELDVLDTARDATRRARNDKATEILDRAKREIDLAKSGALEDLHQRSVELAFDLTSRLIGKTLDPNDHQQLIKERIERFSAAS